VTFSSAAIRPYRTRLLVAAAATLTLALAGCSASSDTDDTAAAEGRTVTTEFGDVVVPEEIESVVVLEGRRDLDIALALELPVTGMPSVENAEDRALTPPLADAIAEAEANGAEEIFLEDEINLEAIAELAPSLIISRNSDIEPIFDELNAIAPVLAVHSHGDRVTWQEDLTMVAEATGTEDLATQIIAEYDARVDEIKTTYAAQIASTPVVAIVYNEEGTSVQSTRLINAALFAVGGLPTEVSAESEDIIDDGLESSPEQTYEAHKDAGAIIVSVETDEAWEALSTDALWSELPAVQAGNVVRTDKQTNEGGPITAMATLDLVEQLYQGL
jgi:iron complex transport system substrate-binding protein